MGLLFVVLPALAILTQGTCQAKDSARRLIARNDTAKLFHHRGFHNSIVAGHYLYIDGGEITTWDGSGSNDGLQYANPQSDGNINTVPDPYTHSIDLSSSWTNSSVKLNQISKAAPVLNNEALWLDASGDLFYAYDGGLSSGVYRFYWYETNPPNNALWQFEPSGSIGHWSQSPVAASSNFSTLSRVTSGNYGYGNGLGFALGGTESYATYHYSDFADDIFAYSLAPGLVMFDSSSQEWFNVSSKSYSYYGFATNGVAQFVPSFGPLGLLFVLGGWTTQTQQLVPLETAAIFDPETQQWQNQVTTGDIPGETANACIVGVEGDDGTYEIFLYGGQVNGDVGRTVANGAVWVLSLPAFHWQKVAKPTTGRFMHSCNIVANRQMAVIGGIVIDPGVSVVAFNVSGGSADPWDQGIGIFDLTELEWKSSYDASAPAYATPDSVKSYYSAHGKYPAQWTNSVVERWFKNPGSSGGSGSSSGSDSSNGRSSSTNAGAIAGGVVGGVAGVAIIAAVLYFVLRRRKRRQSQEQETNSYHLHDTKPLAAGPAEAEGDGHHHEVDGSNLVELPVKERPVEAPSELAGQDER